MTYGNCFEGYLTEGCKDCECWSDKNNYKGYIGCGYCGPIMNCTHFAKRFEEDAKKRREKDQKKGE